jgi:hypothetical protein
MKAARQAARPAAGPAAGHRAEPSPAREGRVPAPTAPGRDSAPRNPLWGALALGPPRLQLKPRVSRAGDASEREADAAAEQVLRGGGRPPTMSAPASASATPGLDAAPAVRAAGRGGEPLPQDVRDRFEPGFGRDLGAVRVHADAPAAQAAQAVQARAYTYGRDIVFGRGEYAPHSAPGQRLLAHELAHVVQQSAPVPPTVQRQTAPAATATTPAPGTVAEVVRFVTRPGDEPDATLAAAMAVWGRYATEVRPGQVRFEVLPADQRESRLDCAHRIGGRSHWDGTTPVIELPQAILDDVAGYLRVRGTPAAAVGDTETPGDEEAAAAARFQRAPLERAHEAVRLIGHEMYHLWREHQGHTGNPIQQPYEREAASRMDQVRANWVSWLHDAPPATLRSQGIPAGTVINRWQDIPAGVRRDIEQGAASTDYIEGLYQRSAYLVEEIYTKVEELSYLRVQQRDTTASVNRPSLNEVSQLATLVYFLNNMLHSQVDPTGLITPALMAQTETAMLAYLRRRYPSSAGAQFDSYEVIFYLSATRGGLPPIFDGTRLLSLVPGARVPP